MNRKGTKRHSQPARSNEDLVRRFVDVCRRTPGSKPASPSSRPSQNSPHRTHGWFFPRRRRLRIARLPPWSPVTRLSGQPRPGRAIPACGPHAGGSGGEHIRPQHRAGGQAVPGARISTFASPHDRARFPPLRRAGPPPATPLVFGMNAATLQLETGRKSAGRTTDGGMTRRTRKTKRGTYGVASRPKTSRISAQNSS